ncbi:MAG TPA: VTT domain-containing protein [Opitutaceae bacterium]|nr:VTT domain-containing protein [Opitutaceae bacterium]
MPKRKLPVVPLVAAGIVLLVVAVLALRDPALRTALTDGSDRAMDLIRRLGAGVFFGAMAILPAVGVPLMAFTVTAGQAFAPQMGMAGVIAASLGAMAINLALGYWVSRYALRPVLAGLIKRYGYSVPRVNADNALMVTLLVRLTPGPPYAVQACILGLAEVPFRLYMIVSWLAMTPWVLGGIILGKGLFSGKFGVAVTGVCVLIVAVIGVQWIRRKFFRRRTA